MNDAASKALFVDDTGKLIARLLDARNWKLYGREFPVLDVGFRGAGRTEMRVRLIASNWNDRPPSIELLDGAGAYLTNANIPRNAGSLFNGGPHPSTGRPFVCMAGSLEYHTYSGHVNDVWENYKHRDSHTLGGIVTQLWNAWLKG
jgi:hypothetical protein